MARGSRALLPQVLLRAGARIPVTVTVLSLALTMGTAGSVAAASRAGTGPAGVRTQPGLSQPPVSQAAVRAICRQPSRPGAASAGTWPAARTRPAAVIRVDQVGYPISAPKRAQIMTTSRRPHGIRWVLVRAGKSAGSGSGQESGPGAGLNLSRV